MTKPMGLLVALVCLCFLMLFACNKKPVQPIPPPVANNPVVADPVVPAENEGEAIKINTSTFEEQLTTNSGEIILAGADLNFPKTDGETTALMNINSYYENIKEQQAIYFREDIKLLAQDSYSFSVENSGEFIPFHMDSDFWVSCNDGKYLSVVRNYDEFIGGSTAQQSITCDTFSMESGAFLNLSDLFSVPEEKYMKRLMEIVKLQAKDKKDLYENYEPLMEQFDHRNFYIYKDAGVSHALMLVYQPYSIAPGNVGVVDFSISFNQIKDILK